MRKVLTFTMVVLLLMLTGPPSHAAEEGRGPDPTTPPAKEDNRLPIHKQDQWQFFLSSYMWIPGMNINTTIAGQTNAVSQGWYDMVPRLFSNVIGVMGRFETWKGKWGLYVDSYFTYLGANGSDSAGKTIDLGRRLNIPVTVVLNGDLKIITRAASVDFGPRYLVGTIPLSSDKPLPVLSLEAIGGGRYNFYNQYIKLNLNASLTGPLQTRTAGGVLVSKIGRSFLEPFLGLRLGLWINPKMIAMVRFTMGGFGFAEDNNLDMDMELDFAYKVHKHIYAYAGWRARYVQFSQDALSQKAWFNGPVLGAVFAF